MERVQTTCNTKRNTTSNLPSENRSARVFLLVVKLRRAGVDISRRAIHTTGALYAFAKI